jgi:hypothetical protein
MRFVSAIWKCKSQQRNWVKNTNAEVYKDAGEICEKSYSQNHPFPVNNSTTSSPSTSSIQNSPFEIPRALDSFCPTSPANLRPKMENQNDTF